MAIGDTADTELVVAIGDTAGTELVVAIGNTAGTELVVAIGDTAGTELVVAIGDTADTELVVAIGDTADTELVVTIGVMSEFDGAGIRSGSNKSNGKLNIILQILIILFVPTIIVLIFIHICNVELTQLVACLMEWLGLP